MSCLSLLTSFPLVYLPFPYRFSSITYHSIITFPSPFFLPCSFLLILLTYTFPLLPFIPQASFLTPLACILSLFLHIPLIHKFPLLPFSPLPSLSFILPHRPLPFILFSSHLLILSFYYLWLLYSFPFVILFLLLLFYFFQSSHFPLLHYLLFFIFVSFSFFSPSSPSFSFLSLPLCFQSLLLRGLRQRTGTSFLNFACWRLNRVFAALSFSV